LVARIHDIAVGVLVSVADNHGGLHPIFARVINYCWFCFKWGLVLLVIGVLGGLLYLDHRVDEEIRCHVERLIAQHYTGLDVSVRSATLVKGEGIKVRELSILERGAEGPRAELANLDEVMLACKTDLKELIVAKPQVSQVTMTRLTIRITRRPDGTFSAAKLLPLPTFGGVSPKVVIENGTIEVFDPLKNPSSTFTLRDVNLTVAPPDPTSQTPFVRKIQGTLTADHLSHVEIEGWIDSQTQRWTIGGTVNGLDVSPEMREALPGPISAQLAMLGNLRGHVDLDFRVAYDPGASTPLVFEVGGGLSGGRLTDDDRLPLPLTDMQASFIVTNEGFGIPQLFASIGQARLQIHEMRGTGFDTNGRLQFQARIEQLELGPQLRDALPSKLQEQWFKFWPTGKINAEVSLFYDGKTKALQPDISVECLGVSFTHDKYPYRLDHGTGSVTLKNDLLEVHLDAYSGNQLVNVDAEFHHPLTAPVGWFEAKGEGLPLDEKLFGVMKDNPGSQAFVRSLQPTGTIDFFARLQRHEPNGPMQKTVNITLNRCKVKYEKFPYPIYNIRGLLEMRDDDWTFRELQGDNDTGRITCNGTMQRPQEGQRLHLIFTGRDVAMEHELRDALVLKPNVQRVWNALRPRGMVDLVAEVDYWPQTKKLSVGLRAEPQSETASIEPIPFPYRMEKLSGVLIYGDGHVTIERFKAEHGRAKMSAIGECDFLPNGNWELRLKDIAVDQLQLDRELIPALPERLKRAIIELNPRGPGNRREDFDLNIHRGSFDLQGGVTPGEPVKSSWDVAIGLSQGSIDCGIKLENLHGEITMAGVSDERGFYSQGELNLDSLTYKDYQLTRLMGPIWIDDRQVLLGSLAERRRNELAAGTPSQPQSQTRRLTAKLLGGTFYGDGWLTLGEQPRYQLSASLINAELERYAQETMVGRQKLRGKIFASVDLHGTGHSINGLGGRGDIHLRDADVYELPVMISMLKILRIREPDRSAFSKCDTEFVIRGPHIYFEPINFNGDAISLRGQGQMDMQSNVDLVFHAVVGRDEIHVPIVSELLGGASEQMMQFQVSGTLLDPVTKKVALPALNQALQQLQNDRPKTNNSRVLLPQARQFLLDQRGPNRR